MGIHETLTRIPEPDLRQVGWSKAVELTRVARRDGESFDCATWLHKAKSLFREGFRFAVERNLTSKETEPWEIQEPIVGHRKGARGRRVDAGHGQVAGYCLEMICADFLAGANLERRTGTAWRGIAYMNQKKPRFKLVPKEYAKLRHRVATA